ncbi:MAG: ATP-binding protein [Cyanobacteria bacterium P01_F01_bin.53]
MAKIESGRSSLNENSFALHDLLNEVTTTLSLRAQIKGLQLIYDPATSVPQYVRADERKLRQVLINLLDNSIKFTEAGQVILRVWSEQRLEKSETEKSDSPTFLTIEVADTGSGIAPNELNSLFAPFIQAKTGLKTQKGTGLGLPISLRFVHLMGGELTVSSRVGQGSTFKFCIPISVLDADGISDKVQSLFSTDRFICSLAPEQPAYRILIVEDRLENRKLMVNLLEPIGFEVKEAVNGQEAIALWESWDPQLIWMDMRMPVMNGYEAAKWIKSQTKGKETVIIALTASAFKEEKAMILSVGCDDFVAKPFKADVIFQTMTKHLGVRYIYKDYPQPSSSPKMAKNLTVEDLTVMSPAWIDQLYQAALQARGKKIAALIAQIPEDHTILANGLAALVENFQFDEIKFLSHPKD